MFDGRNSFDPPVKMMKEHTITIRNIKNLLDYPHFKTI